MAKRKPTAKGSLVTIMSTVRDPRVERTRAHKLCDILTIGLCSMLCGHGDFTEMEEFAKVRKDMVRELPGAAPRHPQPRHVRARVRGDRPGGVPGGLHALDADGAPPAAAGAWWPSTARRCAGRRRPASRPVIVGAWGAQAGISLGQVKVDEKSNEITALPELLDALDIRGCIVTIDAMGCQKEVGDEDPREGRRLRARAQGQPGQPPRPRQALPRRDDRARRRGQQLLTRARWSAGTGAWR